MNVFVFMVNIYLEGFFFFSEGQVGVLLLTKFFTEEVK